MRGTVTTAIDTVRRTLPSLGTARSPTYECVYCRHSYDRDYLNCPACGWPLREGM